MTAPRYPIRHLIDVTNIPDEALPRFYAELPAMIQQMKAVRAAAPSLAQQMRANAPLPFRWLPHSFWVRMIQGSTAWAPIWVDDDKGTITVSAQHGEHDAPFYSRTEKL